jgi:PAS domain-containing protein
LVQSDVEMVLLKQLASCLRIPIGILGTGGDLLFFNDPAESIFGFRFEETGGLEAEEWTAILQPGDETGAPLKSEDRPAVIALEQHVPAHRRLFIRSIHGGRQEVELTAIPLIAKEDRFLGALAIFWNPDAEPRSHRAGTEVGSSVETILTQRLASTLVTPIFVVGPDGRLVYCNEAAEAILGGPFQDSRHARREQLYEAFQPRDFSGNPIAPDDHPLAIARIRREPVHARSRFRGRDGREREIAVTAIPLVGQSDRQPGAFGIFWEIEQS